MGAKRCLHQGNIAQDHRQQVVEVVGHSAGQLTNGFHLLRLPELRFQGPLFRDVPEYTQDTRDLSLIVLDRSLDHAHGSQYSVAEVLFFLFQALPFHKDQPVIGPIFLG